MLKKLADERGLDLVVEAGPPYAYYFKPAMDITQDATAADDKAYPATASAAPAAKPVAAPANPRRASKSVEAARLAAISTITGPPTRSERILFTAFSSGGLTLATVLVVWFVFHFVIPNGSERAEVKQFFQLLEARNYKQAYAMWGGQDYAKPCRSYPVDSFMQDWGPGRPPSPAWYVCWMAKPAAPA